MRGLICLIAALGMGIISGCGGSRNDPGMTDPPTPAPTDTISGVITYKGAPLAGVTVTEWSTNTNAVLATTTTDANGNYSFSGIQTQGNVPLDLHIWATKTGYGFYPSVSGANANAKVERADHTGQFVQTEVFGVPMYFTVIDFVALPNASLSGANFAAYDGTNPAVSVAATGQTASYASGDDGALQKGIAWSTARFTDNQDGTVTDHLTGLIWLKNASCITPSIWAAALTAANQLANGQCGLSDGSKAGQWRLPNVVEFESLIDVAVSNPAIAPGSPFTNVANLNYWTSTSYFGGQEGSPLAWAIRMNDGRYINDGAQNVKATSQNGVWAVRGPGGGTGKLQATGLFANFQTGDDGSLQMGMPLVFPRFIQNNNGTFTDTVTGLTWLKQASCIQGDWATAVAVVRTLASGQCGLTDGSAAGSWRMPNRKEMQSLADRNQNNEADYLDYTFLNSDQSLFQAAIFSNLVANQYYWTSTTDAAATNEAWTVFSCDYGVYDIAKSATGYTLAVR
jgi:hypothetical protein